MKNAGVEAFEKLTREQAERLADLLDESIVCNLPSMDALRKATGPGFTDDELYGLTMLYAKFMHKIPNTTWQEAADRTALSADKRQIYADIAERVSAKADTAKLVEYSKLRTAIACGHPHIHSINIFTEFRPISSKDGITHLVPYLVVDGTVHDPSEDADRQLKLQLNPGTAKKLLKDIADGMDVLETQITEMRKKFGDDAVYVA